MERGRGRERKKERQDKLPCTDGWMVSWMNGWMEKVREKEAEQTLLHECMDRWMDGQTNETVHK